MSQADAMLASDQLRAAGVRELPSGEAEIAVINTCCITRDAQAKSRQAVRRALKEGAREVYVTGCAVNLDRSEFADLGSEVHALAGTAEDVAAEIAAAVGEPGSCADLSADVPARNLLASRLERPSSRTRGFVKVQDGCNSSCAYCVIPSVRGGARSRPATAVLDEVRRRVALGQPEMVMTGISVGDYSDPERGLELGDLMREVARVDGVQRVRLSSVEVVHVRDSLATALADEPRICPHLHVPLQSGDDAVLASMGRHYTAAEYLEAIERVRAATPDLNVTADVIVGFPTETEVAFENTLQFIRSAGINRIHTFSYSERPGTAASKLIDAVPPPEKKRRSRELRALSQTLSRMHCAGKLGETHEVLIDKTAEAQASGYTRDYTRFYIKQSGLISGSTVKVVARELYADGVSGDLEAGDE